MFTIIAVPNFACLAPMVHELLPSNRKLTTVSKLQPSCSFPTLIFTLTNVALHSQLLLPKTIKDLRVSIAPASQVTALA